MGNMCGCGEDAKRNNTTIAQADDTASADPGTSTSSPDGADAASYAAAAQAQRNLSPHRGRKEATATAQAQEESVPKVVQLDLQSLYRRGDFKENNKKPDET